ncbi:MAG TPA: NAD(P)-dependent oxidoreductase [Actinomycetota bacterium]
MRVLVAGAAGAIGRRLIPRLVAAGHQVAATTRTAAKVEQLRKLGAEPLVVDGLDAAAVTGAVAQARPDAIVHQMTALAGKPDLRRFDRWFATTNELRTKGTDILLAAARDAGVARLVAQSYTGWTNPSTGGPVKTEEDRLEPHPPRMQRESLAAIRHLEQVVPAAPVEGIVLRYGNFYGPGASESLVELIRKRRWSGASAASTTSPTTTRPPSTRGCRTWPRSWGRSRRCACRPGSGGRWPVPSRSGG